MLEWIMFAGVVTNIVGWVIVAHERRENRKLNEKGLDINAEFLKIKLKEQFDDDAYRRGYDQALSELNKRKREKKEKVE